MSLEPRDFMDLAFFFSTHGTCSRLQVGALLVKGNRVISHGYNGAPSGADHCYHRPSDDRPCEKSVHAEANTIAFAAKAGISVEGTVLYTTTFPCYVCSTLVVNSGVREVNFAKDYREEKGLNVLEAAGIQSYRIGGRIVHPVSVVLPGGEGLFSRTSTESQITAWATGNSWGKS